MKFTKIKYDGSQVSLHYVTEIKNDSGKTVAEITSEFKSREKPLPEFIEAIDSLRYEVQEILSDILKENVCDKADIRGVSLSWTNDIMGCVITALIPIQTANSPVVVNTPHLPSTDYNPNGDGPTLPFTCTAKLEILLVEAEKYFNGEREKPEELFPE
jgi:hypothetical protein